MDIFERFGCFRITSCLTYTKFAVINWSAQNNKAEMKEVMVDYYKGEISKEDVKEFFMEYCLNRSDGNNDEVPPEGFSFFYELGEDNMGASNIECLDR